MEIETPHNGYHCLESFVLLEMGFSTERVSKQNLKRHSIEYRSSA